MQDLGTLPGLSESVAMAVNSRAEVVGKAFSLGQLSNPRAFYWSSSAGMVDLSTLTEVVAGGWSVLLGANGINDAGQVVGWGVRNGQTRAFLLNLGATRISR